MRPIILLPTVFLLCSCIDQPSSDEVASVTSPDGTTRAILFETNGGATTAFGYELKLRPSRAETDNAETDNTVAAGALYGATRSDCSWGVNLRWSSPTELIVEFMEADKTKLPAQVQIGNKTVVVTQRPGVSDKTAPCGGMLANLG